MKKTCSCGNSTGEKCFLNYKFVDCTEPLPRNEHSAPTRDGSEPILKPDSKSEESTWEFIKMIAWFLVCESGLWKLFAVALVAWCVITGGIQRFKCPQMTETELLLSFPKTVICDFKEC